ncbi:protein FAR1-RELATED SEQUENCE 5-like isoform X2 [Cannabis sativa]|uniref:protein FAR1-RELATED SEQUENCE 5-like isoform X2 n=1 Tax=Cannabis sativa TaxID=3483 RepID=UPI0029CA05FA|nr:protein FAR1-RELATED SEQUENCE 5-like isoform X2 [Cannabis sativa]XP_060973320.1 protein FAR1-RELATED SEQUENCE 5-like isoform X2 [Cannabis sativa]
MNCSSDLDGKTRIELIHSKILDEVIPKVGMEFETEEEAYDFYNSYAYKVGFSIRKSKGQKDNKNGRMIDRIFCCSCQGYREKDKRDVEVIRHRAETRFGCLAMMKICSRQTNRYRVVEFIAEHTHVTTSPSKSHLHRSHRRVTAVQAAEIDMADRSGISPKESCELMARRAGGRENLGMIPVDYKNYLRTKRMTQMKIGDTGGVLEYLQSMQIQDPNFFYAIQVDVDDLITNIFWADAKMIQSYSYFGDVVSFDTTYKKNQDGRPFAMFLGVNNHKQTTVFGAALLYDETTQTFEWLFDTFATAMSGKKPKTILTDQDAAMAEALGSQWPQTYHRLCIWHIYQNAAKNLSTVFERFREFSKEFSNCIYDYDEESEFIEAWNKMLAKYGLEDNKWLKKMYNLREKWALVYGRETFCADMTTTQRSESMNNAIKGYVSYKHNLLRFFENFERLLESRRYEELQADFRATQTKMKLSFEVEILKHGASLYTPTMTNMFQTQVCESYDCAMTLCGENETLSKYKVVPAKKRYLHHTVHFDSTDNTVTCSCKKFEFTGILCSHALKVLSAKNVMKIPLHYILKRWTKDAKFGDELENDVQHVYNKDPKVNMANRYREICRFITHIATKASGDEKNYDYAISGFRNILEGLKKIEIGNTSSNDQVCSQKNENQLSGRDEEINNIKGVKLKGKFRGKSTRHKSALEKATKKKKQVKHQKLPTHEGNFIGNKQFTFEDSFTQALPNLQSHLSVPLHYNQSLFHVNQHESEFTHKDSSTTTSMMELLQQTHSFSTRNHI